MHSFWGVGTPIWSNLTRSTSSFESWGMFSFVLQSNIVCTTSSCVEFICNLELQAAKGWYRSHLRHLALNCNGEKAYQNGCVLSLPNLIKSSLTWPEMSDRQILPEGPTTIRKCRRVLRTTAGKSTQPADRPSQPPSSQPPSSQPTSSKWKSWAY